MKRGLLFPFGLLVTLFVLLVGCGGDKPGSDVKTPAAEPSLDDAFALLPGNAIAVGTVDARAFFGSQTFGPDLAKLVERFVPIGQEAGFQASRDVDRITFASYAFQGIDAAGVVVGRFDEAKIKEVALKHTPTKGGGQLVASQYAGRDLYTLNNVGFTILSPTKAIAGSESGIRRVLERIKDRRVQRDIAKWMIETVETPGAAAAVAADFQAHPMPPEVLRMLPLAFMQNAKIVRLLFTFKEPGMQAAGSATYADPQVAQQAAEQVRQTAGLAKGLAFLGIKLQNIDVKVEKQDVQVKVETDDQSLRQVVLAVPALLGQ